MSTYIKPGFWLKTKKFLKGAFDLEKFVDDKIANAPSGGGENTLASVVVPITAEQVKDMGNTPVVLLSAQGVGTVINPIAITLNFQFGTSTFDSSQYSLSSAGASRSAFESTVSIGGSNGSKFYKLPQKSNFDSQTMLVENDDLLLLSNLFGTINGDGTLTAYLTYEILSV